MNFKFIDDILKNMHNFFGELIKQNYLLNLARVTFTYVDEWCIYTKFYMGKVSI